jgi:hypothetical protein
MSETGSAPSIDYFNRDHGLHGIKVRLALAARRRMYERVLAMTGAGAATTILDVGTTPDLLIPYNNFFERWYPHKDKVTACSVEDCSNLEGVFPGLRFRRISGARLPCADREFDLALSFAVLEHVGSEAEQRAFLQELARGARQFVAYTPYRGFPVEMHTLLPLTHWLPTRWYRALWRTMGMAFWADEKNLNLLTVRGLRRILPAHGQSRIRLLRTLGWPSNLELHWRA